MSNICKISSALCKPNIIIDFGTLKHHDKNYENKLKQVEIAI